MDKNNFEAVERLFETVVGLETVEECAAFFEDICTIKEIRDIAQRLQVAEMLHSGKNYQEISKATGASTATISRVNRSYSYGTGAYKAVLERIMKKN